jgi:phosphoribosylaminoimidazole-succinocarboxamide synthase
LTTPRSGLNTSGTTRNNRGVDPRQVGLPPYYFGERPMITDEELRKALPHVLGRTRLEGVGERYEGKVRDCYTRGDVRILVTTDHLSCFDRVLTTIPFKGQVLNGLSTEWFRLAEGAVKHHLVDVPDPSVMVVRQCELVPFEVIVRGYVAGSAWRKYQKGEAVSGVTLPPGLKEFDKLPEPLLTPSTKAAVGAHDEAISEAEVLQSGKVAKRDWELMKAWALELYGLGVRHAEARGLILADTKYEFGIHKGNLLLIDEIHTLDCSRYWIGESYPERVGRGEAPEMLDKEPTRRWLMAQGFMGEGPIPPISDDYRMELSRHYMGAFERLLGKPFQPLFGDPYERIERALAPYRGAPR